MTTPSLYLAATMVVPVDTPPLPLPSASAATVGSSSMRPKLPLLRVPAKNSCPGKERAEAARGRPRRTQRTAKLLLLLLLLLLELALVPVVQAIMVLGLGLGWVR